MRALVTGGAGFIGSALVDRLLAEGHEVDVVDDLSSGSLANLAEARGLGAPLRFSHHECGDPDTVELVARLAPEVVYHLAIPPQGARTSVHPANDVARVLVPALRVLEGARAARARKLVVALCAADLYGNVAERQLPIVETTRGELTTGRGASLRALLDHLQLARAEDALEFSALALGAVYGPREPLASPAGVALAIEAQLARRPLEITAPPGERVDLLYVDDAVDALSRSASRGSGLLLNVGTGVATTRGELLAAVARRCGGDPVPTLRRERRFRPSACVLDASRAAIHLGWRPWTSLIDGIAAAVAWREAALERGGAR